MRMRAAIARAGSMLTLGVGGTTCAYAQGYGYGPGMMGGYGWGGGWGFGMIGMLLWWLLIILGIVLLAKWLFGGGPGGGRSQNRALEILRERYARGEIDRKEFEERKRDLGG